MGNDNISSFMNESHYMFVYWIVGTYYNDVSTLTLTVSIFRSFESIGSTLANGIGALHIKPMTNLIVAFALFVSAIPTTVLVTFLVPNHPVENNKVDNEISVDDSHQEDTTISAVVVPKTIGLGPEIGD
jgi:hypothetical protein